jgi:hypothetical protein
LCAPLILIPPSWGAFVSAETGRLAAMRSGPPSRIETNIDFVRRHLHPGDAAVILSDHAGIYHGVTGSHTPVKGPGFGEMVLREDAAEVVRAVHRDADKVILDTDAFPVFLSFGQTIPLLWQDWEFLDANDKAGGSLVLWVRRKQPPSAQHWRLRPPSGAEVFLHLTYNEDLRIFVDDRERFANGGTGDRAQVSSPEVNVEALVTPSGREGAYATIVSNHPGRDNFEGFVIHHVPDTAGAYVASVGNGKRWYSSPPVILKAGVMSRIALSLNKSSASISVNEGPEVKFDVPGGMVASDYPVRVANWEARNRPFEKGIVEVLVTGPATHGRAYSRMPAQ